MGESRSGSPNVIIESQNISKIKVRFNIYNICIRCILSIYVYVCDWQAHIFTNLKRILIWGNVLALYCPSNISESNLGSKNAPSAALSNATGSTIPQKDRRGLADCHKSDCTTWGFISIRIASSSSWESDVPDACLNDTVPTPPPPRTSWNN